jgi:hypothetical protein
MMKGLNAKSLWRVGLAACTILIQWMYGNKKETAFTAIYKVICFVALTSFGLMIGCDLDTCKRDRLPRTFSCNYQSYTGNHEKWFQLPNRNRNTTNRPFPDNSV